MKVWITAGGTGSAWHICQIARTYYAKEIELYISDINEPDLVAASTLADHFYKVPPVRAKGYAEYMYQLLQKHRIDLIIPLIPWEQPFFSPDNAQFAALGIRTLAPFTKTSELLNNKLSLAAFCQKQQFPTIRIYTKEEWKTGSMPGEAVYFVKPGDGFGAAGSHKVLGKQLTESDFDNAVVQEYCGGEEGTEELTMEALWVNGQLYTVGRKRLEAKSGVCTKAKICKVPEAEEMVRKMVNLLEFPPVFNVQFVHHEDTWKVMDVNLRLAAGTGISNAAGFQLIRALLASLLGKDINPQWLMVRDGIRSILRVYQEVVIEDS